MCPSGQRSALAAEILRGAGFAPADNRAGGMLAWENQGLPVEEGPEVPGRRAP